MAEENNLNTPPIEQEQIQEQSVAPNLDGELNDALSKHFANDLPLETNEKPKEEANKEKIEDKVEPKPEAPKTEKPIEPKSLPNPESIDKNPPKKGQSSTEGWNALRNNYKAAHKLVQERDEEIKKLKSSVAEKGQLSQKEVEALKSEISELSKYRAMVDIQADPEFVSKYDQPIEKNVNSIKEMLTELNVNPDVISKIDFTNTQLMDKIIEHVETHNGKTTARRLQRKSEELADLMDKRKETLEEHKSKYKEHLESKKKESFEKQAEGEGRMLKRIDEISKSIPFLNKMEVSDGASEAEVNKANQHNSLVEIMSKKVQEVLKMNDPEQRADTAIAAVASHYLTAQLKVANARVKSLEDEIKKISSVTTETERSKNPSTVRKNNGSMSSMDLDDALATHFK